MKTPEELQIYKLYVQEVQTVVNAVFRTAYAELEDGKQPSPALEQVINKLGLAYMTGEALTQIQFTQDDFDHIRTTLNDSIALSVA